MNIRKVSLEDDGTFQIAPLMDIVFLLLVFYLVTSALQQMEKHMLINPPKSQQGTEVARRPYQIIINVSKDGEIIVNKKVWKIDSLANRLKEMKDLASGREAPEFSVIIRADGLTAHQHVINVMDACITAGMSQMWFVTVDSNL